MQDQARAVVHVERKIYFVMDDRALPCVHDICNASTYRRSLYIVFAFERITTITSESNDTHVFLLSSRAEHFISFLMF